jgi:hypothetical protein
MNPNARSFSLAYLNRARENGDYFKGRKQLHARSRTVDPTDATVNYSRTGNMFLLILVKGQRGTLMDEFFYFFTVRRLSKEKRLTYNALD